VTPDLPPLLRWIISILGGGGAAGLVQAGTVVIRLKSTVLTGCLANPIVATAELIGAIVVAVVSVLVPVMGLVAAVVLIVATFRKARARQQRRSVTRGTTAS